MAYANSDNQTITGILTLSSAGVSTGSTVTNHGVVIGASSNAVSSTGVGSTGQVLQGNSAADPTYSTATYPSTTTVSQILYSSSTNTITGLATANNGVLTTNSSGVPSIDTTNFAVLSTGVQMKGNNTNTAPPSGFIGQQIIATGSAVSLSNNTAANICSISLTPGVWDINAVCEFDGGLTGTNAAFSISPTSATMVLGFGDNLFQTPTMPTIFAGVQGAIPQYRQLVPTTATWYLVANIVYTGGTAVGYGRISAVRVG